MDKFRPELVLISAGFDSRIDDPLGQFRLSDDDFADLTRLVCGLAQGRVVSLLEGGYNLSGLASAAAPHMSAHCSLRLRIVSWSGRASGVFPREAQWTESSSAIGRHLTDGPE